MPAEPRSGHRACRRRPTDPARNRLSARAYRSSWPPSSPALHSASAGRSRSAGQRWPPSAGPEPRSRHPASRAVGSTPRVAHPRQPGPNRPPPGARARSRQRKGFRGYPAATAGHRLGAFAPCCRRQWSRARQALSTRDRNGRRPGNRRAQTMTATTSWSGCVVWHPCAWTSEDSPAPSRPARPQTPSTTNRPQCRCRCRRPLPRAAPGSPRPHPAPPPRCRFGPRSRWDASPVPTTSCRHRPRPAVPIRHQADAGRRPACGAARRPRTAGHRTHTGSTTTPNGTLWGEPATGRLEVWRATPAPLPSFPTTT